MKNILIAINAEKLSISDLDFGCHLAKVTGSRLTGIFLENKSVGNVPAMKTVLGIPYVETIVASDLPDYNARLAVCEANLQNFNDICNKQGVQHSVHLHNAIPLREVKSESRFADLLIINPSIHFDGRTDGEFSAFSSNVAAQSECPVVIAPKNFIGINEIVFTYDGSAAAAFAIRQFANIFPEFDRERITIVQINAHPLSGEEQNLKQYLRMHYSNVNFYHLKGDTDQELFKFLFRRTEAFVVMGAYSRSKLSRSFFPGTAEKLIKSLSLPIFIAHP